MNYSQHKENLEKELKRVETELKTVGRINPGNKEDWEAGPQALDTDRADENEVADKLESYEENNAILGQLEIQAHEVKEALKRIDDGTYGFCKICGKPIEEDRLMANYSATTCTEHMNG